MSLWLKQQKQLLLEDKKKLSLIVGLFCVMLLLWGRLILKQVPRVAVADPAPSSSATTVLPSSTQALKRTLSGEKPVVTVTLPNVSQRDLFELDLTAYPTEQVDEPQEPEAKKKIEVDKVEKELKAMVGRIQLESTVLGSKPCAIINGQIVVVGQSIDGLILKEVQSRQVILEYFGRLVRLRMN